MRFERPIAFTANFSKAEHMLNTYAGWKFLSLSIARSVWRYVFAAGVMGFAVFTACELGYRAGYLPTCSQYPQTESDAHLAISLFFMSDTRRSRELISRLRENGMTDEYLRRFQGGCAGCNLNLGESKNFERPDRWYLFASIAPLQEKKWIVLLIECSERISLDRELFGG